MQLKQMIAMRADVNFRAPNTNIRDSQRIENSDNYPFDERITGYPNPDMYNQYFINNYSLPKGLHCTVKDRSG